MGEKKRSKYGIRIKGKLYIVYDIDAGVKEGFKKGNAYKMYSILLQETIVLPVVEYVSASDMKNLKLKKSEPGIYPSRKNDGKFRLILPNMKTIDDYRYDNVYDIIKKIMESDISDYEKGEVSCGSGDAFIPKLFKEDDPLNRLVKLAISCKHVPFNAYAQRLEHAAVGPQKDNNVVGNTKKALMNNLAMSATKASYYSSAFEFLPAYLIKDAEDSQNPAFGNGEILAIFPNGKFDIDPNKIIFVEDVLNGNYDGIEYGATTE